MKLFVKAQHWQLFIVIFGLMVASRYLTAIEKFTLISNTMSSLGFLAFFGWVWSVGIESNKHLPREHKKSPKLITISLIYIVGYTILFTFLIPQAPGTVPGVLIFYLAFLFSTIYSISYTTRQFVTLQKLKDLKFIDYFLHFFMFWIYPIGVWFIQPKVNKLLLK